MPKKRFMMQVVLAGAILSSSPFATSQEPPKVSLIGEITNDDEAKGVKFGAGCFFSPMNADGRDVYVFVDSGKKWMKIRGKLVELLDVQGGWPTKKGEKTTALYEAGDTKIRLEIEQTSQCEEGQECAGASYRGTVFVTDGTDSQEKAFDGECGC